MLVTSHALVTIQDQFTHSSMFKVNVIYDTVGDFTLFTLILDWDYDSLLVIPHCLDFRLDLDTLVTFIWIAYRY